jgi:flagellar assembly protein FliH
LSETARVLEAANYEVDEQPYLLEKVAAAALADLRRKREAKEREDAQGTEPEEPRLDPVALRQREEAAELRMQAAQLLRSAQAKADAVVAEAQTKASLVASAAKESGYKEGLAKGTEEGFRSGEDKGLQQGLGKYTDLVARFEGLLEKALAEKSAYFTDREAVLVELVTQVSAKVIHREVASRPDHIQNLLRLAIQQLSNKAKLLIYLHPADLELITQARGEGLLGFQGVKQMEFLADDKMVQGGVRIASGYQTLDAALDSQLAEICRALLEEAYHEA